MMIANATTHEAAEPTSIAASMLSAATNLQMPRDWRTSGHTIAGQLLRDAYAKAVNNNARRHHRARPPSRPVASRSGIRPTPRARRTSASKSSASSASASAAGGGGGGDDDGGDGGDGDGPGGSTAHRDEAFRAVVRDEVRAIVREEIREAMAGAGRSADKSNAAVMRMLDRLASELAALAETKAVQPGALTVTVEQAQARMGCSRRRVFELLKSGDLKRASKIGRRVLVTIESIDRVLLHTPKPRRRRVTGPASFRLEDVPI